MLLPWYYIVSICPRFGTNIVGIHTDHIGRVEGHNNSNFGWSRAAFTTLLSSRCGSAATSIILFWLDYTGPLPKDTNSSFPILSPKHFPESILTAKPVFPWHWTHLLLDLNWKSGVGEGREERASLVNHAQLFALFYFNALQISADDT